MRRARGGPVRLPAQSPRPHPAAVMDGRGAGGLSGLIDEVRVDGRRVTRGGRRRARAGGRAQTRRRSGSAPGRPTDRPRPPARPARLRGGEAPPGPGARSAGPASFPPLHWSRTPRVGDPGAAALPASLAGRASLSRRPRPQHPSRPPLLPGPAKSEEAWRPRRRPLRAAPRAESCLREGAERCEAGTRCSKAARSKRKSRLLGGLREQPGPGLPQAPVKRSLDW